MPPKRKHSTMLSEDDPTSRNPPLPVPTTSRQLRPRLSSRASSRSGSLTPRRSQTSKKSGDIFISVVDDAGSADGSLSTESKKRHRHMDNGKGKGKAKASEELAEEEIDELESDSENAAGASSISSGDKGKGKARYVETEDDHDIVLDELEEVDELQSNHSGDVAGARTTTAQDATLDKTITANPSSPVAPLLSQSSDIVEVPRVAVATPPLQPEPLSVYTCPVCFCPPTKATLTPCGHILCGQCLFTAVKTTIRRGVWAGESRAKCPVCRAVIAGWDGRGGGVIGIKARAVFSL